MIKRFLEIVCFLLFFIVYCFSYMLFIIFPIIGAFIYIITGNRYYIDIHFFTLPLEKTEELQEYLSEKLFG